MKLQKKHFIWSAVGLMILSVFVILPTVEYSKKVEIKNTNYLIIGKVVDIGNCFVINSTVECAVIVVVEGDSERKHWNVIGSVTEGQLIYKHCWDESPNKSLCFIYAELYKRIEWR